MHFCTKGSNCNQLANSSEKSNGRIRLTTVSISSVHSCVQAPNEPRHRAPEYAANAKQGADGVSNRVVKSEKFGYRHPQAPGNSIQSFERGSVPSSFYEAQEVH